MFYYYAHCFNYHDDVIAVASGGTITKEDKKWTHKLFRDNTLFCIEDPFETSHNLGRLVHAKSLHMIRGEFMRAHRFLVDSIPVDQLFQKYQAD